MEPNTEVTPENPQTPPAAETPAAEPSAEESNLNALFDEFADDDDGDREPEEPDTQEDEPEEPAGQSEEESNQAQTQEPAQVAGSKPEAASQEAASPPPAAQPDKAKDIWASASPELKAAHDAAVQEMEQKWRSEQARTAPMNRRITELVRENQRLRANTEPPKSDGKGKAAAPAAAQTPKKSIKEDPKVKQVLEDYPDVAGPLIDAFDARLEEISGQQESVSRDLSKLTESRRTEDISANERTVTDAHSDWKELTAKRRDGSWPFMDWLQTRSEFVQQMAAHNGEEIVDAGETIELLDLYKSHLARTGQSNKPANEPPSNPGPKAAAQPAPAAQPGPKGSPAPSTLSDRRARQLAASRSAPAGSPGGPQSGASGNVDAMFDQFAAEKERKRA